MIGHFESGTCVLFDLDEDPDESRNLADDPAREDDLASLQEIMRTAWNRPEPRLHAYGVRAARSDLRIAPDAR